MQGGSDDIDESTVQGLFASNYETRVSPHYLWRKQPRACNNRISYMVVVKV